MICEITNASPYISQCDIKSIEMTNSNNTSCFVLESTHLTSIRWAKKRPHSDCLQLQRVYIEGKKINIIRKDIYYSLF